jgi:hypothetical protein
MHSRCVIRLSTLRSLCHFEAQFFQSFHLQFLPILVFIVIAFTVTSHTGTFCLLPCLEQSTVAAASGGGGVPGHSLFHCSHIWASASKKLMIALAFRHLLYCLSPVSDQKLPDRVALFWYKTGSGIVIFFFIPVPDWPNAARHSGIYAQWSCSR